MPRASIGLCGIEMGVELLQAGLAQLPQSDCVELKLALDIVDAIAHFRLNRTVWN